MMREPWFWRSKSNAAHLVARALSPLSYIYDIAQRARWKLTAPYTAPAPVICIGNASLGGEGKTPFAIMLSEMLMRDGLNCQFLTRGYGGKLPGPVLVDRKIHGPIDVGDEALLLSRSGPTWVARNRVAGAQAATNNNADVILMDDGFQNPTIQKTLSILLYGGEATTGNNRIFPAGPLREPLLRAVSRADLIVLTSDKASTEIAAGKPLIRATIEPANAPTPKKVVAFSGIGKPAKFFDLLTSTGFEIAKKIAFPDHHFFSDHDIKALRELAKQNEATLITTEKDFVRLSSDMRDDILTFPVAMRANEPGILHRLVMQSIGDAA